MLQSLHLPRHGQQMLHCPDQTHASPWMSLGWQHLKYTQGTQSSFRFPGGFTGRSPPGLVFISFHYTKPVLDLLQLTSETE